MEVLHKEDFPGPLRRWVGSRLAFVPACFYGVLKWKQISISASHVIKSVFPSQRSYLGVGAGE